VFWGVLGCFGVFVVFLLCSLVFCGVFGCFGENDFFGLLDPFCPHFGLKMSRIWPKVTIFEIGLHISIDQAILAGEKVQGISPRVTPSRENRLFSQRPLRKMAKSLAKMEWNVPEMEISRCTTALTRLNTCQSDRSSEVERRKSVRDKPKGDSTSRKSTF
jgi:hypothetical protein